MWPIVIYFAAVLVLVTGMLTLSYFLGQRHMQQDTGIPYESGVASFGSAHLRQSSKFYLIALFFVIFDLESVFIFAWAVDVRDLGWPGYLEILIFITILFIALIYLWRLGALDLSPLSRLKRRGLS